LTWFDRTGKPAGTLGEPGEFWSVDFSPDHKRVAVTLRDQNDDIWIYDVARALPTRITVSPAAERTGRPVRSCLLRRVVSGDIILLPSKAPPGCFLGASSRSKWT
jgi:hypothetical protein